jgi:hypothetical protein
MRITSLTLENFEHILRTNLLLLLLLLLNVRGHSNALKARRGGSNRTRAQKKQKGSKDRG